MPSEFAELTKLKLKVWNILVNSTTFILQQLFNWINTMVQKARFTNGVPAEDTLLSLKLVQGFTKEAWYQFSEKRHR